jgi:Domain of unknown function (DUF5615)
MGAAAASARSIKLLLDEMLDPEIGVQLRRRRWNVESIQREHQELIGLADTFVLERATQLGRALVTDNVRHFLPLHNSYLAEQKTHAGLILAHPRSYPRSKKIIGVWVRGLEQVLDRLASASTENLCEWLP